MRSAYEIFADELERHLQYMEQCASSLQPISTAEDIHGLFVTAAKSLEQRFHVVKGGAGFLKLERIASISESYEECFKHAGVHREDMLGLKDDFLRAVQELREELERLRALLASE